MAKMSHEKLVRVLAMIVILTVLLATWKRSAFLQDFRNDVRGVNYGRHKEHLCQPLRFYNTSPPNDAPPLTALHSFPGSGNTWIRHLLHQATGVYTGNRHPSAKLMTQTEFLGDMRNDTSVLCIKTHLKADNKYARAVILIRNPKDAFVAEFSRQRVNKVERPPSEVFETEAWKLFLSKQIAKYRMLLRSWLHEFKGRKFVVFYEDLKDNLLPTLNDVVQFLTGTDISNTVKRCILQNGQGVFLRKGSINFDPYSSVRDLMPEINQMKTQLMKDVQKCVKAGRCEGG